MIPQLLVIVGLGEKKTIRIKQSLTYISTCLEIEHLKIEDLVFNLLCFYSPFQPSDEHTNRGVDFMVEAAEAGDRGAMVYMGRAFETGDGLGTLRLETIQFILF